MKCLCGCAGAELANVLNEAALETVRRQGSLVSRADIYNGMDRILQVLLSRPPLAHDAGLPLDFGALECAIIRMVCVIAAGGQECSQQSDFGAVCFEVWVSAHADRVSFRVADSREIHAPDLQGVGFRANRFGFRVQGVLYLYVPQKM